MARTNSVFDLLYPAALGLHSQIKRLEHSRYMKLPSRTQEDAQRLVQMIGETREVLDRIETEATRLHDEINQSELPL